MAQTPKVKTKEEAAEVALELMRQHNIRHLKNHTTLNIETKLKEKGLSTTQFADKLGVAYPTVRGWINGERVPKGLSRKAVEKFFGESVDTLLKPTNG